MLEKLANPMNIKRSFEMKLVTDDEDDEVFIVHDEDDQDDLFLDAHFAPEEDRVAQSEVITPTSIENPFKTNLFNSEQTPSTQKLDVQIQDNYIKVSQTEVPVPEMSTHSENIMKRRKQNKEGKKHNISIHQFDEETQIAAGVAAAGVAFDQTMHGPLKEPLLRPGEAAEPFQMVPVVDDHIQSVSQPKQQDVGGILADEEDGFNDREDDQLVIVTEDMKEMESEIIEGKANIVGRERILEFQDIEDLHGSKDE